MDPFTIAVDRIFTHPHFSVGATLLRAGSDPLPVRILLRQADTLASYGRSQIIAETVMLEVRVSEVADRPEAGDVFEIGSRRIVVLGGAQRDSARLTWVCEARDE